MIIWIHMIWVPVIQWEFNLIFNLILTSCLSFCLKHIWNRCKLKRKSLLLELSALLGRKSFCLSIVLGILCVLILWYILIWILNWRDSLSGGVKLACKLIELSELIIILKSLVIPVLFGLLKRVKLLWRILLDLISIGILLIHIWSWMRISILIWIELILMRLFLINRLDWSFKMTMNVGWMERNRRLLLLIEGSILYLISSIILSLNPIRPISWLLWIDDFPRFS